MRDDVWVIGALLVVLLAIGLALYGWRLMKRSNRSKAAVLSRLLGQVVTILVQGETIVAPHTCVILRLDDGLVVVRELPNLEPCGWPPSRPQERVFALGGIREVKQGDQRWGPW
jgi:hypothetical protein